MNIYIYMDIYIYIYIYARRDVGGDEAATARAHLIQPREH